MRERTGRGQAVEVSMAESTLMATDLVSAELSGIEPEVGFRGGQHWSGVHRLGSGRDVSVTVDCASKHGFGLWTRAAGRTDLADDARFATAAARHGNREVLRELLGLPDDELDRLAADGVLSDRIPEWRGAAR